MKCLVAGGAGFIGSHLIDRMAGSGWEVTVVDNLVTGNLKNLENVRPKVDFFNSDIADFKTNTEFDMVFHLAAIANPNDYVADQYNVLRASSFGTDNLLRIAEKSSARFCYISSSEVYGHRCTKPEISVYEDSFSDVSLLNERSPYFVGKMFSEEYVKAFCTMKDIDHVIIRPFNIYGTRMDSRSVYGRVVTNFFRQAASGHPLTINGDGEQTRSFCHVDDFVDALILLTDTCHWKHHVLNVGNPNNVTINSLAKKISLLFGNELKIEKRPSVPFEPRHRRPKIDRVHEWLGWAPKTNLDDGLHDIFEEEYSAGAQGTKSK